MESMIRLNGSMQKQQKNEQNNLALRLLRLTFASRHTWHSALSHSHSPFAPRSASLLSGCNSPWYAAVATAKICHIRARGWRLFCILWATFWTWCRMYRQNKNKEHSLPRTAPRTKQYKKKTRSKRTRNPYRMWWGVSRVHGATPKDRRASASSLLWPVLDISSGVCGKRRTFWLIHFWSADPFCMDESLK